MPGDVARPPNRRWPEKENQKPTSEFTQVRESTRLSAISHQIIEFIFTDNDIFLPQKSGAYIIWTETSPLGLRKTVQLPITNGHVRQFNLKINKNDHVKFFSEYQFLYVTTNDTNIANH